MTTPPSSTTEGPTPPLFQTVAPNPDDPTAWNYVEGAWFDEAAVERVISFFQRLRHTIGEFAGEPFELLPWQVEYVIKPIFGWKRADGSRLYRRAWIEVPRKAGKTTLCAGLALYGLLADNEMGAHVFAAATGADQAALVFQPAALMAEGSPAIQARTRVFAKSITVPKTASSFRVLASRRAGLQGLNVHVAVIDEVHEHDSPDIIQVLETGVGARRQPLVLYITTADTGEIGTIYDQRRNAIVRQSERLGEYDFSVYGAIWSAPDEADPFSLETWKQAQPGLGLTVSVAYYEDMARAAKNDPLELPSFRRYLLNQRVRSQTRWLSVTEWDECSDQVEPIDGRVAWAGLDLSKTTDFSAFVVISKSADGHLDVEPTLWIPRGRVDKLEKLTGMPLSDWAAQGFLTLTEGTTVDYTLIEEHILATAGRVRLRGVGFDPWNATELTQRLGNAGVTCVPLIQGARTLSAPAKELERMVIARELRHGGHPVMRWMASVVEAEADKNGNIRLNKPDLRSSSIRIDGIAALVDALAIVPLLPDKRRRHAAAGF